jgi:hypothetical protein
MLVVFLMMTTCQLVLPTSLDDGKSGVYGSPMATDELVMEFGFLFGGGRSGVKGMEALQVRYALDAVIVVNIVIAVLIVNSLDLTLYKVLHVSWALS